MVLLLLLLLFQSPFDSPPRIERGILECEHARSEDISVLLEGLKHSDPRIQRLALRALGRLERPEHRDVVVTMLGAKDPAVRQEAANALAQMRATVDWISWLRKENAGEVRGVMYEAMGRVPPIPGETERMLAAGLSDGDRRARAGAAKGIEALFRLNRASMKPSAETIEALRAAIRDNASAGLRQLALLALNAAGDWDEKTFNLALGDPNPQVRRLAVIGSKRFVDDPSPMVRYEALKLAGNCERAVKSLDDASDHIALLAVDLLGIKKCDARTIERLVDRGKHWRIRARALVSLAKVDAEAARRRLPKFSRDAVWQARAYAAEAAKIVKDDATLAHLAKDSDPNVAAAALNSAEDAIRALASNHYGLLLAAAQHLKGHADLPRAVPPLLETLRRLSLDARATSRDPRMEFLERLREAGDRRVAGELRSLLMDLDPAVAARAAEIITAMTGAKAEARTKRYAVEALPPDRVLRGHAGATARIKMRGLGTFTIRLFPEEAPATVAVFARLAGEGYYNGLTFHRIAPNFVIQGGSPGANEYDGIGPFMRDEAGMRSHARGTLGISTRGRDTGDAQIFVNLVDNFRLDRQYTVFAEVIEGMDVVDRVQEGDVIQFIRIRNQKRF
jgi:cyclophilin family peptidyl-prolyl cis-trans isomerase/HEAT repeat protein